MFRNSSVYTKWKRIIIFLIIILGVLGNFDINAMGVLVHKNDVLSVLDIHVSSKRNTPNKMIPKMLQTAAQD